MFSKAQSNFFSKTKPQITHTSKILKTSPITALYHPCFLHTQILRTNIITRIAEDKYKEHKEKKVKSEKSKPDPQYAGIKSFAPYEFYPPVTEYLNSMEIYSPTPIQDLAFKNILKSETNLFLGAQTGTGKTLAYLLPIMQLLKQSEKKYGAILTKPNRPRAVIFLPTKELIEQVGNVAKQIGHHLKISVLLLSNEHKFKFEVEKLNSGVDQVITNIKRFERHLEKKTIYSSAIEYMAIDEADAVLDSGNIEIVSQFCRIVANAEVIANRDFACRLFLISATQNNTQNEFIEGIFGKNKPNFKILIDNGTHQNLSHVIYDFIKLVEYDKHKQFLDLVEEVEKDQKASKKNPSSCIVFCNTIQSCISTDLLLKKNGYDCVNLHGDIPAKIRIQNYHRFNNKEVRYLICTDLGARGLDFKDVTRIINFDFPKSASDFLHRAGRTGRVGKKGKVSSQYRLKDNGLIKQLRQSYEQNLPLKIGNSAYSLKNTELLNEYNKLLNTTGHKAKQEQKAKLKSNILLQNYQSKSLVSSKNENESGRSMDEMYSGRQSRIGENKIRNFKKKPREKEEKLIKKISQDMQMKKSERHSSTKKMQFLKGKRKGLIKGLQMNPKIQNWKVAKKARIFKKKIDKQK